MSDPGARPSFAERLADPLSHFPYKHSEARTGAARVELMRGLDRDATDEEIAASTRAAHAEVDATAAYVEAQEAYLREPTEETRAAEREAAVVLQQARRARRDAREGDAPDETPEG